MNELLQQCSGDFRKWRSLFDNHPEGICSINLDGYITSSNRAYQLWSGYSEDELLRMHFSDMLLQQDKAESVARFVAAQSPRYFAKVAHGIEARVVRKNGEVGWLSATIVPSLVDDVLTGWFSITRDITHEKELEMKLERHQEMLNHLQRIAHIGSWELDVDRQCSYWSDEMFNIFGLSKREFVPLEDVYNCVHPEDRDHLRQAVTGLGQGQTYDIEFRVVHPDGQIRFVRSRNDIVIGNTGGARRIGTAQDITDLKLTEQKLINSEKLESIGQLAAGIAHEIRNPLTSITGFINLLRTQYHESDGHYFDILEAELKQIEMVSGELLSLGRPQLTSFKSRNVEEILMSTLELFQSEMDSCRIKLTLSVEVCPPVMCAEDQLRQALLNIIKNALEAMPDGGKLSVRLEPLEDRVVLIIADSGEGISPEMLVRLGDPFFTTKPTGNGLGLMITRTIIEKHNGSIRFESTKGVGTTVTVELPVQQTVSSASVHAPL